LNIFARALTLQLVYLKTSPSLRRLICLKEQNRNEDELKDANEDEHCLESIFVVVFWSLTLHNVIFEIIVLWGFLSCTSNAVDFTHYQSYSTMSYQVASY
jgi:hypothetical protein